MSPPNTLFVHQGRWNDYSLSSFNRLQHLVTSSTSQVWTNAVSITMAILLSGVGFAIFFWILKLCNRTWLQSQSLTDICNTLEESGGGFVAIRNIIMFHVLGHQPIALQTSPSPTGWGAFRDNWSRLCQELQQSLGRALVAFLISFLLICFIIGFNAGLAFIAVLAGNSIALSDSPLCDVWRHPSGLLSPAAREFDQGAESRARLYGVECYGKPTGTDGCNLYFNQSINFEVVNITCPFSQQVCDEAGGPALKFETPYLDSKILGLNIRRSPHFRRSTICSPVATDERYVRFHTAPYGLRAAEYHYGNGVPGHRWNGIESDFTYNSSVTFTKDTPSYSVAAFRSKSQGDNAYILPEFRVPNYTTTLLIIEEGLIFHSEERDDPVFSAHNRTADPKGLNLWYNGVHHGGVLMCVDQWEICPKGPKNGCWNNDDAPEPYLSGSSSSSKENPSDEDLGYALLWHALLNSNTYASIRQSQSIGLDAQRHINNLLATGLAEQQWQVESRLLFQTSLARLQQDLYDIERGTANDEPGFERTLPESYRDMCRIYKFRPVGWTNVSVAGTIVAIVGSFVLWVFFRTWSDQFLVIWLGKGFWELLKCIFYYAPIWCGEKAKQGYQVVKSWF